MALLGLHQASKIPTSRSILWFGYYNRAACRSQWLENSEIECTLGKLGWTKFRAASTISARKLKALAQKPLPTSEVLEKNAGSASKYPTVVQEAYDNMRKYPDCVILTKVGGFYELYFEQAEEFGPLLNLKVAKKKLIAGTVSMVACLAS